MSAAIVQWTLNRPDEQSPHPDKFLIGSLLAILRNVSDHCPSYSWPGASFTNEGIGDGNGDGSAKIADRI